MDTLYEPYTRQALPEERYRTLLGTAICVFNSNFSFIIENIIKDGPNENVWGELIGLESGRLQRRMERLPISSDAEIGTFFRSITIERNRIIHSFQITDDDGSQTLATRDKEGNQFKITEKYLLAFIKKNEQLSNLLHKYRGY